jgi:excisionase family DNA binding protein
MASADGRRWTHQLQGRPGVARRDYDLAMEDHLSTRAVGWILGRSAGTVRDMIVAGEIEATRTVDGYRIPKAEVLRLGRERIEAEAGRKLRDTELERLIDEVIQTNEAATG